MLKTNKLREINARNIFGYMLNAGYLTEVYWGEDDYYVVALVNEKYTGKYFKNLVKIDKLYGLKTCCIQKAMTTKGELKLLWDKKKEIETAQIELATDQIFGHLEFLNSLAEGLGK